MFIYESEFPISQTLAYLTELRDGLCTLIKTFSADECPAPPTQHFTLFSSPKVFRSDELTLGLHRLNHFVYSSKN